MSNQGSTKINQTHRKRKRSENENMLLYEKGKEREKKMESRVQKRKWEVECVQEFMSIL